MEQLRSAVRPLVTFALVLALIAAAFLDTAAAGQIRDPALIVVGFWFGQRLGDRDAGA